MKFLLWFAISIVALSCAPAQNADQAVPTQAAASASAGAQPEESAFRYPVIELRGRLHEIFTVSGCAYISGLTCRISYNGKAPLPSEVFFVGYDATGAPDGSKVRLIYPRLEVGEFGQATFRIRSSSPAKLVLEGSWDGPWKNPY
jgi:hypothetical protein